MRDLAEAPQRAANSLALPVMEMFYTLQGEGTFAGCAAYFIRLGGCDVGCHWCDVKESWDINLHPSKPVHEIVAEAKAHPGRLAVVTGGEPAMHNLENLTASLRASGFQTNIETSGVYELTGKWDWVCFSPKKFKEPTDSVYAIADELKVIVYHRSDLEFAERHAARLRPECRLLLQAEWSRRKTMNPLITQYVRDNPRWRVSLQTHKYLNIP